MFIGEWAEKRGIRDQLVIATKVGLLSLASLYLINGFQLQYSNPYTKHIPEITIRANHNGNNMKSLNLSLNQSLKNLRTTYIDILYVHYWDFTASIEEVMNGLHNLVVSGKVLYLASRTFHVPIALHD